MFAAQIALIGTAGVGAKSGSFSSERAFCRQPALPPRKVSGENVCANRAAQWCEGNGIKECVAGFAGCPSALGG